MGNMGGETGKRPAAHPMYVAAVRAAESSTQEHSGNSRIVLQQCYSFGIFLPSGAPSRQSLPFSHHSRCLSLSRPAVTGAPPSPLHMYLLE
jgi:hypothetical protein